MKIGVSEFKIPAMPLSTRVCAVANKNAGTPEPHKPINTEKNCSRLVSSFKPRNANGNSASPAIVMRSAATSTGSLKTSRPLLIRMNDEPHVSASAA